METNEIEKRNIELDVDEEQMKLKLEFEHDKKRLVSDACSMNDRMSFLSAGT